jgi:hypothetical protein
MFSDITLDDCEPMRNHCELVRSSLADRPFELTSFANCSKTWRKSAELDRQTPPVVWPSYPS